MAKGRTRRSSAKGTKRLKSSSFAYPKTRAYPINTRKRARAALAYSARKSTRGSYAQVAKAVKRKYPSMKLKGKKR
jgi:hypothetical protein